MFFALRETAFIATLDERISALMNCPVENGEGLQVLRYFGPGAKRTHPTSTSSCRRILRTGSQSRRSGQRISSLVIYLNEVAGGGETVFPEIGLSGSCQKWAMRYISEIRQQHAPKVDPEIRACRRCSACWR